MRTIAKSNVSDRVIRSDKTKAISRTRIQTKTIKSAQSAKVVSSKLVNFMDTSRFRFNQTPVETPNGILKIFTLPNSENYVSGLLEIFLDGLQQIKTTDWTETTSQIFTFTNAPDSDENIRINYIKK